MFKSIDISIIEDQNSACQPISTHQSTDKSISQLGIVHQSTNTENPKASISHVDQSQIISQLIEASVDWANFTSRPDRRNPEDIILSVNQTSFISRLIRFINRLGKVISRPDRQNLEDQNYDVDSPKCIGRLISTINRPGASSCRHLDFLSALRQTHFKFQK